MSHTRLLIAAIVLAGFATPVYAAAPPGKPIPRLTPGQHQEEMKKEQAEWSSMTPEQKQAFRSKRRAEFLSRIQRKTPPQGGPQKFERQEKAGLPVGAAGNVPEGVAQNNGTVQKNTRAKPAAAPVSNIPSKQEHDKNSLKVTH